MKFPVSWLFASNLILVFLSRYLCFFILFLASKSCSSQSNDCKQICLIADGKQICDCNKGYKLDNDGKSCIGKLENIRAKLKVMLKDMMFNPLTAMLLYSN